MFIITTLYSKTQPLEFMSQPKVLFFNSVNHGCVSLKKQKDLAQQNTCSCTEIHGFQSI